jgi:UDP-N-acetylglucosamine diphosphorylase/glucosamine-1-phosphate N-acetyltransferase
MAQLIIFEDARFDGLLPLVYWRASYELRCGVDTLLEKLRACQPADRVSLFCRPYLQQVVAERWSCPVNQRVDASDALLINGRLRLREPLDMPLPSATWQGDVLLAARLGADRLNGLNARILLDAQATREWLAGVPNHRIDLPPRGLICYPWDLVLANANEIVRQWPALGGPARSGEVAPGVHLLNEPAIRLEEGSRIKSGAVLDAEEGPIIVGAHATIAPNCVLQGPCYVGPKSLLQPATTIRHGTSIGPVCKVGGEIDASIIHGYTNKQHDGFLGHAYIGEWVNIGADTVNSDLKNTYGTISVPLNGVEMDTGEMFVGMFVGDHTKTGINVTFSTGAVVGFCCSVVVSAIAPRFVPSFSWLTDDGRAQYDASRALAVARRMMARRNVLMTAAQNKLFMQLPEIARQHEPLPR